MWFKNSQEREEFDAIVADRLRVELSQVQSIRKALAELPSFQLVDLWFGTSRHMEEMRERLVVLRGLLRSRAALFSWVHGPGRSIARDLLYVRLPSSEKRILVSLLIASVRPRFPWVNSRLMNAMAFQPNAFRDVSKKSMSKYPDLAPWGPLYRHVVVSKGRGKRHLHIPNVPLKRIQKALLRLIGPSLERGLLNCVYGTSGSPAPVFHNAVAHTGKAYIASFDIRDFFPSTRKHDVLRGLTFAQTKSPQMIDVSAVPSYISSSPQLRSLSWTHDAAVFVASLATHKGKLPQGSPLSPVLANVAFSVYDQKIIEALTHEFGRGQFTFTRYFDDLTISVSLTAANRRDANSTTQVKNLIHERVLEPILANSPYQLQCRKSHCSTSKIGHNVTGLVVRRHRVELTRNTKRHLRLIIHHLQQDDFVAVARKWFLASGGAVPEFVSVTQGHRWKPHGLRRRKCPAERLAALMLRHFSPDLKLERLLPDWYPWQEKYPRDEKIVERAAVWPMIEWLLAASWANHVGAIRKTANSIEFQQAGTPVCALSAESSLDFFFLPKDMAIPVVEYWHHLRGVLGFLRSCPEGEEFEKIRQWRDVLDHHLDNVRLEAPSVPTETRCTDGSAEPETFSGVIRALGDRIVAYYNEYARRIGTVPDGRVGYLQGELRHEAHDLSSFQEWVSAASELFVRRLPYLPRGERRGSLFSSDELFDYMRLKEDFVKGRIGPHYTVLRNFEDNCNLRKADNAQVFRKAQHRMFLSLESLLDASSHRRQELEGSAEQHWIAELSGNVWCGRLEEKLVGTFDGLAKEFCELRSDSSKTRLFVAMSGRNLPSDRPLLTFFDSTLNSDSVWKNLFDTSKALYLLLYESLDSALCTKSPSAEDSDVKNIVDWKRRQLWNQLRTNAGPDVATTLKLIESMRNREAHGDSADRRKEWLWIQKRVRDILGRSWVSRSGPKHPEFHANDDLELRGYEGGIVKLSLLTAARDWLCHLKNAGIGT